MKLEQLLRLIGKYHLIQLHTEDVMTHNLHLEDLDLGSDRFVSRITVNIPFKTEPAPRSSCICCRPRIIDGEGEMEGIVLAVEEAVYITEEVEPYHLPCTCCPCCFRSTPKPSATEVFIAEESTPVEGVIAEVTAEKVVEVEFEVAEEFEVRAPSPSTTPEPVPDSPTNTWSMSMACVDNFIHSRTRGLHPRGVTRADMAVDGEWLNANEAREQNVGTVWLNFFQFFLAYGFFALVFYPLTVAMFFIAQAANMAMLVVFLVSVTGIIFIVLMPFIFAGCFFLTPLLYCEDSTCQCACCDDGSDDFEYYPTVDPGLEERKRSTQPRDSTVVGPLDGDD